MLSTKNAGGLVGPPATNDGETVKVKIISGTIVNGDRVEKGMVVEVTETVGRQLLAFKKAVPSEDKPQKPTTRKPRTTTRKKGK